MSARSQISLGSAIALGGTHLGQSDVPAVRAVDQLLSDAIENRASDMHLEDQADQLRVRVRIDGILEDVESPPNKLRSAILARLRVMGGMDLAERRAPQDGRMRLQLPDRRVDIRVSTVPILHGESMALRILDPKTGRFELDDLGIHPDELENLSGIISRPHGMVLTTGPGGSGKSTSLYAIVKRISTGREKIFTIEDPVEYDFEGICQVLVNHRAGLTFATLLRSLVRQDPDVLLVGEIRDEETADIAMNAALTGHLVLSTLHTTDTITTFPRLVDLGVPAYLIAHSLEVVIAQRLVRKVCTHCAEEAPLLEEEMETFGSFAEGLTQGLQGAGCDKCRGTGYLGRTGLYEVLSVNDRLREAFLHRWSVGELREIAMKEGLRTLRQDGADKVRTGITTPAEVLRVT